MIQKGEPLAVYAGEQRVIMQRCVMGVTEQDNLCAGELMRCKDAYEREE